MDDNKFPSNVPGIEVREISLAEFLHATQGADGHSYLWGQIFFTEPVGQWLCPAGHSCRWSVARTDAGVMDRFQRRRAPRAEAAGSAA